MQRISINLTNDCVGNQLNYDNDLPTIGNKNYALHTFRNRFFVIRHLLSSPPPPPKAADHAVALGTRFCAF